MTTLTIAPDFVGQVGVKPRIKPMFTTDSFATVTTAGYLNQFIAASTYTPDPSDIIALTYGDNISQFFTLSFSGTVITLQPGGGDVVLPVVSGDFAVFSGTAGNIADLGYLPSNAAKTKVVMASAAVLSNHIACFSDTSGTVNDDAPTAFNGGNIQAGLSGTAGTLTSYPSAATTGYLQMAATANSGDFAVQLTNVAMAQGTTIQLPDPGGAQANILLKKSTDTFIAGDLLQVRTAGTAGLVSDSAIAANKVLTSSFATPDTNANIVSFSITVGQADIASGASKTLYTSSGSKQFRIVDLFINSGGTAFSGGGGNRLGQVTDGTTVYSVVPAANLQTLTNNRWGVSTPLPFPAAAAANALTAAGASLVFKYSGGTTDYTAGSIVVSGYLERIA